MTLITPSNPPTQLALQRLLSGLDSVITWVDINGNTEPLSGGLAPTEMGGYGEGLQLVDIKGLGAPFKHIDQQGAHQDGATWLDAPYDPIEIDMTLVAFGRDQIARRRVFRRWMDGWDAKRTGRLWWFTAELGHWWIDLRLLQEMRDTLAAGDARSVKFAWAARGDFPFWSSYDSISTKLVASNATTLADPAGNAAPNFMQVSNRGDQDSWTIILCHGPGTFTIGDNGGPRRITLPLNAGELARIETLPNRRTVVEVNTGANIYPRLVGRFSTPIAAGATVRIPITVTGAQAGVTSAVASLTPLRKWPE
ncbi:hypothetical protein B7C42_01652 [Nocardia cerradoensis]|uniref:Uncharacterized protein n=1 Tax=Nocardia cerradoensis TaxID=85688 RepID=A0A231HD87_9NOCA|nr:hypothetical protein [Nocardia cerradoensis]OXR46677.1 hypothetical protein B7C42_01652 [Nocardia cerradoensis]